MIRIATTEDAQSIHELHTISVRSLCKEHYSEEQINAWLTGRYPEGYRGIARHEMFVFEDDDGIKGFGHAVEGEILAIFVDPEYINQGIGSDILKHAIKLATKDKTCLVKLKSTLNASGFYSKFGFKVVGKGSDKNGPYFIMEKKFNQANAADAYRCR
jgi:putative acetyltransferase